MTEQKIEQKIITRLTTELSQYNIQIIGSWQATAGTLKSVQTDTSNGTLIVKVLPRSYQTPTVPDANIVVELALTVRADLDKDGCNYLSITDKLVTPLQRWQQNYEEYSSDFNIENEFEATGFTLNGGNISLDNTMKVWTYNQQFTIYGLLTN